MPDHRGLQVHVNDPRGGGDLLPEFQPEVELPADQDQQVRLSERFTPGVLEELRGIRRQCPPGHPIGEQGEIQLLHEPGEGPIGVTPADGAPGHHHRPLRLSQHRRRLFQRRLRRAGPRHVPVQTREGHVTLVHEPEKHIQRDFQEDRAGAAAHRMAEGHFDKLRDPLGFVNRAGPLGDRPHHRHMIHFLKGATAELCEGPLAADDQHRAVSPEGVGHPGDAVGDPRASGDHRHPGPTGQASPGIGGVDRGLLVADVDDPDPLIEAPVVDRQDVAPTQGEDHLHPCRLQRLRHQPPAVHARHLLSSCSGSRLQPHFNATGDPFPGEESFPFLRPWPFGLRRGGIPIRARAGR